LKKHTYLLLIPLIALLYTCRKSDAHLKCTDKNTVRFPQQTKEYFYFKEGSWWLYENQGTGETDSQWVGRAYLERTNATQQKKNGAKVDGKCYEYGAVGICNKIFNFHSKPDIEQTLISRQFQGGVMKVIEKLVILT
jgi:hypothetical protein